jgi:hypothetical protein
MLAAATAKSGDRLFNMANGVPSMSIQEAIIIAHRGADVCLLSLVQVGARCLFRCVIGLQLGALQSATAVLVCPQH